MLLYFFSSILYNSYNYFINNKKYCTKNNFMVFESARYSTLSVTN